MFSRKNDDKRMRTRRVFFFFFFCQPNELNSNEKEFIFPTFVSNFPLIFGVKKKGEKGNQKRVFIRG